MHSSDTDTDTDASRALAFRALASRTLASRVPWWLMLLLVVMQWPAVTIVLRAFGARWHFPAILPSGLAITGLSSTRLQSAAMTSIVIALLTGVASAWIGVTVARGVLRAPAGTRRVATMLMFLPAIAPPVALGVGLQMILLRTGLASTWIGVWLAHLIPAVGYVSLYLFGVLSLDDVARDEAARTLGASAWQTWRSVTWHALRRRLGEAVVLGALVSWGQLALTLLVGGGVVRTLPVELLSIIRSGDDRLAAIAAIIMTVPPLCALSVLKGGAQRTGVVA